MVLNGTAVTTRIMTVHRIALDVNKTQDALFANCAGIARFSWNWALDRWKQQYAAYREDRTLPKPNEAALRRELNAVKAEAFPWMLQAPKSVPQQAIKNLGLGFRAFFAGRAHYPTFKAKNQCRDSFRPDNGPGTFRTEGSRLKLPRIGWVRMRETLRFGPDLNPVLKSVRMEPLRTVTGVDLGVTTLATLSNGRKIAGSKALRSNLKKLARLQRAHARKARGGKNRARSRRRIAKLHARIRNIRQDGLHKLTTGLAYTGGTVVIENLNVRGMMANRRMARAIADMGFFEFRRQLTYKLARAGGTLIVADRFFASSKTCSCCEAKAAKLPLSVREWTSANCGAHHDRGINAAINLRNLAGSEDLPVRPVTACGAEGAGAGNHPNVKPAATKQELAADQKRSGP